MKNLVFTSARCLSRWHCVKPCGETLVLKDESENRCNQITGSAQLVPRESSIPHLTMFYAALLLIKEIFSDFVKAAKVYPYRDWLTKSTSMKLSLLRTLFFISILIACSSPQRTTQPIQNTAANAVDLQPQLDSSRSPQSLMDLPQTQFGGFVLRPGFYEAEFKTYCLQPGTPDPHNGDAYVQGPISGYRKDIIQSVLTNSRDQKNMEQRNIQLLLWSIVTGSNFNNLSYSVQNDAAKLLTPKQIFQLKGGVVGVMREASYTTGLLNSNNAIKQLFETSINSYEAYERIAVRREQSQITKHGVKYNQWYRQKENYFVRFFPESYKKVKIQVYVPGDLLDAENKLNGEYLVFDPTGQQGIPTFTNAQRLGIGAPAIIDMVRQVIKINKALPPPKKIPPKKNNSNVQM
jgi:hypothetical protein